MNVVYQLVSDPLSLFFLFLFFVSLSYLCTCFPSLSSFLFVSIVTEGKQWDLFLIFFIVAVHIL